MNRWNSLGVRAAVLAAVVASTGGRADPGTEVLAPLKGLETRGARVGALVQRGQEVLAAHRPDEVLNPASVTKIFTAAAALDLRGPDFQFVTTFFRAADGEREVLVLRVSGDPSLTVQSLENVARCLRDRGIRAPSRFLLDMGGLAPEATPPAFQQKATLAPYRAGAAPFQVDLGRVTLTARATGPGQPISVSLSSSSDRVRVQNQAVTADGRRERKGREPFRVRASVDPGGCLVIRLSGRLPAKRTHVESFRVPDPQGHALGALQDALKAAGIRVPDTVEFGTVPPGAQEVCRVSSPPLREILVPMLRDSLNPVAEAMVRELGRPDREPSRQTGFSEGVAALQRFLRQRVGLAEGQVRFRNGSGLYDANAVTPRATVALLQWVRDQPWYPVFRDALPVAGADQGTLRRRLKGSPLENRVRAKTGTLERVVSLAGFLEPPEGNPVEFAFLVEGPTCSPGPKPCPPWDRNAVRQAMDQVLLSLWGRLGFGPSAPDGPR